MDLLAQSFHNGIIMQSASENELLSSLSQCVFWIMSMSFDVIPSVSSFYHLSRRHLKP